MFRAALMALALLSLNCDAVIEEDTDGNNSSSNTDNSDDAESSNNDDAGGTSDDNTGNEEEESNSSSGDACETCVGAAVKGACKNAVTECNESDACNQLGACLEKCKDNDCINQCGEDHADGKDLYIAANDCIFCGECQEDCEVPADSCGGGGSSGSDSGGSSGSSGSSADMTSCTSDGACGQDAFCVQVEQGQAGYCSPMCNPTGSDCPDGFECKGDAQQGFACVVDCSSGGTADCPTGWQCHQAGICMP